MTIVVLLAFVFVSQAFAKPVAVASYPEVNKPSSVAVDSSGDLYVADYQNHRIDELGPSGEFLLDMTDASLADGLLPYGLAVDPSSGDVWVSSETMESGQVLVEFGPSGGMPLRTISGVPSGSLVIDGSGDVWIGADESVQEYSSSGTPTRSVVLHGLGEVTALVVTPSAEYVYAIGTGEAGIRKFAIASGTEVGSPIDEAGEPQALALSSAGDLYVGGEAGSAYSLKEYDSAGVQVEQFGTGQVLGHPGHYEFHEGVDGIAVDGATRALYTASDEEGSGSVVQRFVAPVPGPLPEGERASGVSQLSATVEATLDPENHASTYEFEYGTEPGVYGHSTGVVSSPATGFGVETVHADLTGLLPDTTYYYRLTATSYCNEAKPTEECRVSGEGESFTTLPAVDIESESALEVSSDAATFEGVLNPLGAAAHWWVQYGTQEGVYSDQTAVEALPTGSSGVPARVHVQGLAASTAYYYRFVASDEREGVLYESYGEPLSFTTQSSEPSSVLPDGRAWEMVSPLDKQDAAFEAIPYEGGVIEAAANGSGIAYLADGGTEASAAGEPSPQVAQILSKHDGPGWDSRDITSPHEKEWAPKAGNFDEFFAFSPDLSVALVEPQEDPLLGGATERTPYLRQQADCENGVSAPGCYVPLVTSENVTSGEKWGGLPVSSTNTKDTGEAQYVASTPDLSHVVLYSGVPLTTGASGQGIYEWSAGRLQLVSVLPGVSQTPACGSLYVGGIGVHVDRNVISSDGDRVIWEGDEEGGCGSSVAHLYMREAEGDRTVQLDLTEAGASGDTRPEFQDANSEASRVFFTDEAPLTADSSTADSSANNENPDLYVYEANADSDSDPGVVRDLTVPVHTGELADVLGTIPGVSTDGSVAYVVAGGVLSAVANERGETARSGQPNLYRIVRVEESGIVSWRASFIARLSQEDDRDWAVLARSTAGVSTNGQWLAFMSDRSLTGYDNRDAVSGEPDEEVYLYDAGSDSHPPTLVCASCDPSGARPRGFFDQYAIGEGTEPQPLIDSDDAWVGRWIAGVIPAWDNREVGIGIYQPRYLSDSGRLFFDSADALVPQDVNEKADVYEYEPPGVGSCASGTETYSVTQDGCIGLISSGISSEESVFLDASENGNDVFFLTAAKLVAQDTDNAYDVYDAHVCGSGSGGTGEAEWACSPPAAVSPPCSNTSSCRAAPEPQPSVFGAPSSATFVGSGNLAPASSTMSTPKKVTTKTVKCKKGFVKKKDRCVKKPKPKKAKKAMRAERATSDRRAGR